MASGRTIGTPSTERIQETLDWLLDVVGPRLKAKRERAAAADQAEKKPQSKLVEMAK